MIRNNYFKKIVVIAILILFIFPFCNNVIALNTKVATVNYILPGDSANDSKVFAHIIQRVNEIQAMDKSNLSASEKKALRKELKELKHQADGLDSKVYLSVGAIIIIILLLILILR